MLEASFTPSASPCGPTHAGAKVKPRGGAHRGAGSAVRDARAATVLSRSSCVRTSTLHRDLAYRPFCGDAGELQCPSTWNAEWVKHRLVEAFMIERRIPDRRIGPAMLRNTWKLDTTDTFADRVAQGEAPRAEVFEKWAREGGASSVEVSRMEEALGWPGAILVNGSDRYAVEARCLLAWAFHAARGRSLGRRMRQRGWSRTTFYRAVDSGSRRIADHLNARAAAVR
jgi:hypothetical protein